MFHFRSFTFYINLLSLRLLIYFTRSYPHTSVVLPSPCPTEVCIYYHNIHNYYLHSFIVNTYIVPLLGGNLFDRILQKSFYLRDDRVRNVFFQLINAVVFCNENSVYHRDIKPENIPCSEDDSGIYLTDFGMSTQNETPTFHECGSMECMSPGMPDRRYSTRTNDIWSLGVVLTTMVTRCAPWAMAVTTDYSFNPSLQDGDHLRRFLLGISPGACTILKKIFRLEPRSHISLADLQREITELETFF
ncbi:kinase-like protein, partial [Guyanagaster necrorhizus]